MQEIAGFRAIIAHRLHANIIAYSLGIPSVGLSWDHKVVDIGTISGRERYFTHVTATTPADTVALLHAAIAEGIDPPRHADLRALAVDAWRHTIRNAGLTLH